MRRFLLRMAAALVVMIAAGAATSARAWVTCGPIDVCIPESPNCGCICLFFSDETNEFEGWIEYQC